MQRIRIVGLCLAAAFALSAVAASSASASEILFKFTNGNIEQGGTFLGGGGASSLHTANHIIKCTEVHTEGKFHNAHLGLALILFLGCTTVIFSTVKCTSSDQTVEGNIHLTGLEFHLGLAHNTAGTNTTIPAIIILLPTGGISFSCGGVTIKVTGNVIGALHKTGTTEQSEIGKPVKSVDLAYEQSGGVQALKLILLSLGGGTLTGQHLESEILGSKEEAGQESVTTLDGFKNSAGEATEIELVEG